MGGIGSGQYVRINAKETTDNYRMLSVNLCHRKGILAPGSGLHLEWTRSGNRIASLDGKMVSGRMEFTFRQHFGGERRECVSQSIRLEWRPCAYGGTRPYFLCPKVGCGRRVAILYCGGRTVACRHCRQLAYPSQRERSEHRAIRHADKIRKRLSWKPGIFYGAGDKPKGMHWNTFEKLTVKHDALVDKSLTGLTDHFGLSEDMADGN